MRHIVMLGGALLSLACLDAKPAAQRFDADKAALQEAFCEHALRCGDIAPSHAAACRQAERFGTQFLDGRWLWNDGDAYSTTEALLAGRLAIDPTQRDACIAGLRVACDSRAVFDCMQLFDGRVADGEACRDDFECASRQCLVEGRSVDAGCDGRCVVRVPVGAACDAQHHCADGYCEDDMCQAFTEALTACPDRSAVPYVAAHCAPGLQCSAGLCRPGPATGEACELGLFMPCALGLHCVAGLCGPPGEEGAACELQSGLGGLGTLGGSSPCVAGLYCDEVAERCRARLPIGSACLALAACEDGSICIAERCEAFRDVGAPCTPSAPLLTRTECARDLSCDAVDHVCVAREERRVPLGEACDPSSNEPTKACREGQCEPTSRTCQLFCGAL